MDFNDRVLQAVRPFMADSDESWTVSPCLLKRAMYECVTISFREGHELFDILMGIIRRVALPVNEEELSVLRAYPLILGLCLRYTQSPYCSESPEETFENYLKLQIIRGGVRPGSTDFSITLARLRNALRQS